MSSTIAPLLEGFSDRASAAKDELLTYATCDPAGFRAEALPVVVGPGDEAGRRYLVQLLLKHASLAYYITDPARCTMEDAGSIAKAAQLLGVPLETPLEAILNTAVYDGSAGQLIIRIINLFSALRVTKLILRLQKELLAHADVHVRSRAVLELVRAGRGPSLAAQVLLQGDARVQANAVEALWDLTDENATPVLLIAAKSPYNRVAANGLLGLYRRNVPESIPQLIRMACHQDPAHRLSAIWAIGETLDPRFLPFLNREFGKTAGQLKLAIIRALSRIRREHRLHEGAVRITLQESEVLQDGSRRLVVALSAPGVHDEFPLSSLSAMHFAICEESELVTNYSVRCLASPPLLILGFAFPRFISKCERYAETVTQVLNACASLKRDADPWVLERYLIDDASRAAVREQPSLSAPDDHSPLALHKKNHRGFIMDAEFIREVIEQPGPRDRAALDVSAVIKKLVDSTSRLSGPRHLFVFFDPGDGEDEMKATALQRLVVSLPEEPVSLHGFVPGSGNNFKVQREVCAAAQGGTFHILPLEEMERAVTKVYLGLLDSYEIVYRAAVPGQPPPQNREVRVTTPVGTGVLTISS